MDLSKNDTSKPSNNFKFNLKPQTVKLAVKSSTAATAVTVQLKTIDCQSISNANLDANSLPPTTTVTASVSSSTATKTENVLVLPQSQPLQIENALVTSLVNNNRTNDANVGSILSVTLTQPQAVPKPNATATAKLLQKQLTSNNPYRQSTSTDEVPGFLKEIPAQIVGKRHSSTGSSMEASNTINGEKDAFLQAITTVSVSVPPLVTQKANAETATATSAPVSSSTRALSTENFTTVTIHKSDETKNVLLEPSLEQLLQQASNTTPSTSSLSTIVSRSVTSFRAPSLVIVSSLEAELPRPVCNCTMYVRKHKLFKLIKMTHQYHFLSLFFVLSVEKIQTNHPQVALIKVVN